MQVDFLVAKLQGGARWFIIRTSKAHSVHTQYTRIEFYCCWHILNGKNDMIDVGNCKYHISLQAKPAFYGVSKSQ